MPTIEPVRRGRHIEVTSVVEVDAVSPVAANRVTNLLMGAANTRRAPGQAMRIETLYDEERARLKVILVWDMDACASMFKAIEAALQS